MKEITHTKIEQLNTLKITPIKSMKKYTVNFLRPESYFLVVMYLNVQVA